jgi:Arc/MetJ family transcription regulator
MQTNIVIDSKLIQDALLATGLKAETEVVEKGLKTLIKIAKQMELHNLRGKIEWIGDLDVMRVDK